MRLEPTYPIETARLRLRPLAGEDTAALLTYRSDPEVCRYVPFEPMTEAVIAERLDGPWARHAIAAEGDSLTLGVVLPDTNQLIGDVMVHWNSAEHQSGEIGYMLNPASGGRGYATEAMHAILHLAFDDLGLHRVIARIDGRNDPSCRVCDRLGMRKEAHLLENEWFKGEWTDEIDYGLLRSEWDTRSGTAGCQRCLSASRRDSGDSSG